MRSTKFHALLKAGAAATLLWASAPALADDNEGKPKTSEEKTVEAKPYPDGINCYFIPNPSGYSVIDSKHLTIEATRKKYYLVTLFTRCFDLRSTFSIRLDRMGSQLCGPGDAIITERERCPIRYLEPVAGYDEAEEIVEARKAAEKDKGD